MPESKTVNVRVTTKNLALDKVVDVRNIDHFDSYQRLWLGRHTFWAVRNNHEITLTPTEAPK